MSKSRSPEIITPKSIGPLASLPLFHNLEGRKVLVAGCSEAAIWKAELVAAAGAKVAVFAGENPNIAAMENVEIIAQNWQIRDFEGAALAIISTQDDNEAKAFVMAARGYGVPVNVIDTPALCDFQFGAIVNRSPLVIGIATNGAAPALGQVLRGRLEAMLPQAIGNWLRMAQKWRPLIKQRNLDFGQRRAFWHRFASRALNEPTKTPRDADMEKMLENAPVPTGEVALIGAGPGDPELLTLKAMRALQRAEVVLFDDLVEPSILDFARREARLIGVGKRGGGPSCAQTEISALLVKYAKLGKYVVRVKGGDPLIFGRATEEIAACREAGVTIEIIPGISAAQGVASSLGFSLTDREFAQRVQFVTGASKNGGLPQQINWPAIADNSATTFVYMPRSNFAEFAKNAIAAGLGGDTPAALVIDATREGQKSFYATISRLPIVLNDIPSGGPEIIVIGRVLQNAGEYNGCA
ncbi:MAG: siroheme synthase CysG [Pseudomonadota bacterium]